MILSDSAIKEYVDAGLIAVKPCFDERQLRPYGLRVHLGGEILRPRDGLHVDLRSRQACDNLFERQNIVDTPLVLEPGMFVLGSCIESIRMDRHILGMLDGRNTIARLGIGIHCSSNVLDGNNVEFRSIVIEVKNAGPFEVLLPFRYPIGMVLFHVNSVPSSDRFVQNQYAAQEGVMEPNLGYVPPNLFQSGTS